MSPLYLDPTATKLLVDPSGTKLMAECCCVDTSATRCQWVQEWTFACVGGCDESGAWVDGYIDDRFVGVSVSEWQPDTDYLAGQYVVYDYTLWQCLEAHHSGETFEEDEEKWTSESGWRKWSAAYCVSYAPGVAHHAKGYEYDPKARCTVLEYGAASEGECESCPGSELVGVTPPTLTSEDLCGAQGNFLSDCDCQPPDWIGDGQYYYAGVVVWHGTDLVVCNEGHVSGATFEEDVEKWDPAVGPAPLPCTLNLTIEGVEHADWTWLNASWVVKIGADVTEGGGVAGPKTWNYDVPAQNASIVVSRPVGGDVYGGFSVAVYRASSGVYFLHIGGRCSPSGESQGSAVRWWIEGGYQVEENIAGSAVLSIP
jgi:hypothetical protein